MARIRTLINTPALNTQFAWAIVALLLVATAWNLLTVDVLWAAFALLAASLAVTPAGMAHDRAVMPPWELLLVAAAPIASHALITPTFTSTSVLPPRIGVYLAIVALAALAVIELQAFSAIEMTSRFAGVLMMMVTMAVAGVWVILGWLSEIYLGIVYFTNLTRLMWDLITITAVSLLSAPLFARYINWRSSTNSDCRGSTSQTRDELP